MKAPTVSALNQECFAHFLDWQFAQLAEKLPLNFILLIDKQSSQDSNFPSFSRAFKSFCFSEEELKQLTTDIYIAESCPFLQVSFLGKYKNQFIYIFPIIKNNLDLEYLLFFSSICLSSQDIIFLNIGSHVVTEYLKLYQNYLQQNDEIRVLEHLIHQVGHELRNPLSLVTLISENIRLNLDSEKQREQLLYLQQIIQDVNDSLNQLIDCSKRAKIIFEPHNLKDIFLLSIKQLKHLIDSKRIYLQYPEYKDVLINVDILQMQQVFGNVLSNAIYFSPEGGTISCNWQIFQQEIICTISDQGSGLSEKDLKNIFNAFYSRRSGGTGLGLTIVKKIIMDHGGSIWAENLPHGGAQFTFTLPRYRVDSIIPK